MYPADITCADVDKWWFACESVADLILWDRDFEGDLAYFAQIKVHCSLVQIYCTLFNNIFKTWFDLLYFITD